MIEVHKSEYMELVARKLFGISNVPREEQARMVTRLAKEVDKLCIEKDDHIKHLEEQLTWKPIDDYARSGKPVILAYMDCSTIAYAVCDYIDDVDGYLSFCTISDRVEVFEEKILGYIPIPEYDGAK